MPQVSDTQGGPARNVLEPEHAVGTGYRGNVAFQHFYSGAGNAVALEIIQNAGADGYHAAPGHGVIALIEFLDAELGLLLQFPESLLQSRFGWQACFHALQVFVREGECYPVTLFQVAQQVDYLQGGARFLTSGIVGQEQEQKGEQPEKPNGGLWHRKVLCSHVPHRRAVGGHLYFVTPDSYSCC